jgi:hypothetical protein
MPTLRDLTNGLEGVYEFYHIISNIKTRGDKSKLRIESKEENSDNFNVEFCENGYTTLCLPMLIM